MLLEAYIWTWMNLHPIHAIKTLARLTGLAALIILPLLALNVNLVRNGFRPTPPRPELQISQSPEYQGDSFERR